MTNKRFHVGVTFCSVALVALALAACGGGSSSSNTTQSHTVTIKAGQSFSPFILVVPANSTVTFDNSDTASHTAKTTPQPAGSSNFLNPSPFSLTLAAGAKQTQSFTQPGLYDYYDDTMGAWNTDDNRVAANKGIPTFPLAVEGVIWVQGNVSGLPATSANSVISGKDDFANEFVAVSKGGSVSWHNNDTDKHYVQSAAGWTGQINPEAINLIQVNGTDDAPPSGQTQTHTFNTPGLYYYFCTSHADVDPATHRVKAHADASEYPIPMEGFVLVQ